MVNFSTFQAALYSFAGSNRNSPHGSLFYSRLHAITLMQAYRSFSSTRAKPISLKSSRGRLSKENSLVCCQKQPEKLHTSSQKETLNGCLCTTSDRYWQKQTEENMTRESIYGGTRKTIWMCITSGQIVIWTNCAQKNKVEKQHNGNI